MKPEHHPSQNHLLAALDAAELATIYPSLKLHPMRLGDTLYEPGKQLQYAYFPTTAVVSLHHLLQSGGSAETATVGNEGIVGLSFFMGEDASPSCAVVRSAGYAYRLNGQTLAQAFYNAGSVRSRLLRYLQALIAQISQTVVCNRHHSLEQRFSRWLLFALDRHPARELVVTQEQLSYMLGVRREGVSEVVGKLQEGGLIRSRRGHIAVLDRLGLEARACECYRVVGHEMACLIADMRKPSPGAASPADTVTVIGGRLP